MCLVKTSDTVADETARQEKIKERVDEWMSNMISQMKVSEHSSKGWPFFHNLLFLRWPSLIELRRGKVA